jgi:hypothetical protein
MLTAGRRNRVAGSRQRMRVNVRLMVQRNVSEREKSRHRLSSDRRKTRDHHDDRLELAIQGRPRRRGIVTGDSAADVGERGLHLPCSTASISAKGQRGPTGRCTGRGNLPTQTWLRRVFSAQDQRRAKSLKERNNATDAGRECSGRVGGTLGAFWIVSLSLSPSPLSDGAFFFCVEVPER